MKRLLTVLAVALVALAALGASRRTRIVEGKHVLPGPAFNATPLVDVTDLHFYACKLRDNDADCSVITGNVVSHLAHRNFLVTVELELHVVREGTGHQNPNGTVRVTVDRPVPGEATPFVALGPPWFNDHVAGTPRRLTTAHFLTRTHVRLWKPPPPAPLPE